MIKGGYVDHEKALHARKLSSPSGNVAVIFPQDDVIDRKNRKDA
jgi:hypothetical protein